jgi:predicted ATPase with chaperone activity
LQVCPPETASGRCERSRRDEGAVLTEGVEVSEFDAISDIVLCMTQLNLSARAYHRILKLARTIGDLAEALQYGPKSMMG